MIRTESKYFRIDYGAHLQAHSLFHGYVVSLAGGDGVARS
jgi:hypothetical protein